jgi:hypothetical protein
MQQLACLSLLALCLCLAPFANAQTANAPQPLLANVANADIDPDAVSGQRKV